MVALVILAILAGLSVPMFNSFVRNQRVKTTTSDLAYALTFARGEALKRNAEVDVLPASDPDGWAFGWTVTTAAVATPLLIHETPGFVNQQGDRSSYLTITGPDAITYNGDGRPVSTAVTVFEIRAAGDSNAGSKTRCVFVDLSGLPRTTVSDSGECS